MPVPVTNFGKVVVSTGYNSGATSIVLNTGHGSRLPSSFPYPLIWWNATDYPDPADDPDREIVSVTNRSGDTLTVTRAAESTTATNKNLTGKTYKMILAITKAMWDSLATQSQSQSFHGLQVRTHPDSDKAAAQAMLVKADSIVMDDGQEIKNWSNLSASLASSGAGGLDTGSEQASTWYEIYAIHNPTTVTKNLMFHRAKDYFLDESYTTDDNSYALRRANVNVNLRLAQGFQLSNSGKIEFVDIKLQKQGTPTGNYWVTIQANTGGVPTDTALATSDKYDVSRLPSSAAVWVRLPFRTPFSASAATQYHLVLHGDFTPSDTNNLLWRADITSASYANGTASWSTSETSSGWTADSGNDFCFKIYVTQNESTVTMPSGYTQKALIGHAYNNGSSNLVHFIQVDRRRTNIGLVSDLQIGTGITTSTSALRSLASFIPPIPVVLDVGIANESAGGGAVTLIGPLTMVEIASGASLTLATGQQYLSPAAGGSSYVNKIVPVFAEYQGINVAETSTTMTAWAIALTW